VSPGYRDLTLRRMWLEAVHDVGQIPLKEVRVDVECDGGVPVPKLLLDLDVSSSRSLQRSTCGRRSCGVMSVKSELAPVLAGFHKFLRKLE
jgi:hypothetical protein